MRPNSIKFSDNIKQADLNFMVWIYALPGFSFSVLFRLKNPTSFNSYLALTIALFTALICDFYDLQLSLTAINRFNHRYRKRNTWHPGSKS